MIALAVLLALAALGRGQILEPACAACEGTACEVMDNVRVNKLCASELCVDGDPVVVGDGDPCTSDDLVNGVRVSVPIKDCCASQADCEQWMPDVCYESKCIKLPESNSTHGVCVHTAIANCCASEEDCAPRACQTVTCQENEGENQVTFTKLKSSDAHFTQLDKRQQTISSPGRCVYEDALTSDGCCTESSDCVPEAGQECFCDAGNKCVCLSTTQFECVKDVDCQAPSMELNKCRAKGRCFEQVCDRGFCTCKPDFDKDSDTDGVCCRDDCNDLDPAVKEPIFCTVLNGTVVNKDNDTFVKCGSVVEEFCGLTCPPGRVKVNETQLDESSAHGKKKELYVRWDCDCCDDNRNNTRPDEYVYCALDADRDGVPEPVPKSNSTPAIDLTPPGCFDKVCVIQPTNLHNKSPKKGGKGFDVVVSDEIRDAQCAEFFNNPDFVSVPPENQIPDQQCDQCGENPDLITADDQCPVVVAVGDAKFSPCSGTKDGTTLAECCTELLLVPPPLPQGVPADAAKWRACCASFNGDYPDTPDGTECDEVDGAAFPLELEQCGCEPTEPLCERPITCVPDKDHDWYYACEAPTTFCADPEWLELVNDLAPAEAEDKLCRKMFKGENFAGMQKVTGDSEDFGKDTFCDCDDTDKWVYQKIACFKDADGDGFPARPANVTTCGSGKAQCEVMCKKKCPKGYLGLDHKVGNSQSPNCQGVGRAGNSKRYADQLRATIAKSCGNKCGDNGHHDDEQTWFVEDDDSEHSDSSSETEKTSESSHSSTLTKSTKTKSSETHEHPPRRDESCDGLSCDKLDCCDKDKWTYPETTGLPVFTSPDVNACGNRDYNCNCENDTAIICGAEPFYESGSTQIFKASDNDDDLLPLDQIFLTGINAPSASNDLIGKCVFNEDKAECKHQPGWSLEHVGGLDKKKRALSVSLMSACTAVVKVVRDADTGVVKVYDAGDATKKLRDFRPGDCAEWVEGCTEFDEMCSPDCEICVQSIY